MIDRYFTEIKGRLEAAEANQGGAMESAARAIAGATLDGRSFYAFGCSHSGLLVQDIYYRAGTFMLVNPIFGPGMSLSNDFPPTKTSAMERIPGLARVILDATALRAGDVLLLVSTSGRNRVPVEMAREAKARGAVLVVLTSLAYSSAVQSHDPDGKRVADLADIVLDNMAPVGDAALSLDGVPAPVGPVSSVIGTAMLHAIMARVAEIWAGAGRTPPVYMSGNLDAGPEFNAAMLAKYRSALSYRP